MSEIRFDGRVAIVTGAGRGLGKSHALLLASRGAKVVVNDLGGAVDGAGDGSQTPAEEVVTEIKAAGGEAIADYNGVHTAEGGQGIIETATKNYGKVDILINNAGILRDVSFIKQTEDQWDMVHKVHLYGAYYVTKAAWPIMKENKYGRVIMTTSAAGLYGNFGQTNYSSAKLALVGFMNSLKAEGAKYNILVNTIAPGAVSRMTESIMPKEVLGLMKPELVSPVVALMCAEDFKETGLVIAAGAGHFAKVQISESKGVYLDPNSAITIEDVQAKMPDISNMEGAITVQNAMDGVGKFFKKG
ncbi:MAG: SDR family oxidoreductase [Thermodesulfobacteriota bacterium]|nr:SDR family oxidoreductase [Thermodesulfobacteriota bacterium]